MSPCRKVTDLHCSMKGWKGMAFTFPPSSDVEGRARLGDGVIFANMTLEPTQPNVPNKINDI